MKKRIIAVAVIASFIPAAALASGAYTPPAHLIQPADVDCKAGGIIADLIVSRDASAHEIMASLKAAAHRYTLACGNLKAVKILVTNNK